jgi:hypothetical protein
MEPSSPADQDERVESLPWERLATPDGVDRRRMALVAAAVVVAAVTASAARTLWPSAPLTATPDTSVVVASATTETTPPTTTEPARLITEADLRAISPEDAIRAVTARAQWFVTEWLTIDGATSPAAAEMMPAEASVSVLDESARSFVESAIVTSVTEVGESAWEVAVLVRSLSAFGDAGYIRIPARVFLVTVSMGEDGPFVMDVPTPGPLPIATASSLDLVDEQAPSDVVSAAIDVMSQAGLVEEASIGSQRSADLWRVSGVVRDDAGVPIAVVVWTDSEGRRVPAPLIP